VRFFRPMHGDRLARALVAAGADPPRPGDRRSDSVRVRVRMGGTYRLVSPDARGWCAFATADLSAGGAAIECSAQPLQVGDVVLVRLERHPDIGLEPMQLRAEVRNRRGNSDIYGIMWTRLTREQQTHLIQVTVELARLRREFERLVAEQDRTTARRPPT
jgi:hypothetical protein